MIIFQITLTGPSIQHLAMLKRQKDTGLSAYEVLRWDGRYVSTSQNLLRQGLATHATPINKDYLTTGIYKFSDKKRRFPYEITAKGEAALSLVAYDLKDFLDQVQMKALPDTSSYSDVWGTAGRPGLHTSQGEKVDQTGHTQGGEHIPYKGRRR